MPITVFYAWQSDSHEDVNRYFVRDALKDAIKKLKAEVAVEDAPVLDHDTKNVPGLAHIADSIRTKIRNCGVFVADISFVATYTASDGREKRTPNPNVLIELGMAMEAAGNERIVLVQNA